jgi:hypothetical protein
MKKIINVLVIEDNEYYNNQISNVLQQSACFVDQKGKCKLVLHSFKDSWDCIWKIKSGELENNDIIAFVDYYLGMGMKGTHIIKLLKSQNNNIHIVLLSQTGFADHINNPENYDYYVIKDKFAPALCKLYLEQFVDNYL